MKDFNSWLYILSPMQMTQHSWMLHVASVCTPCCMFLHVVGSCFAKFETCHMCKQTFDRLPQALASLNYEKADLLDVMNSNRKFDVSLDGTVLSRTTNLMLNSFVLTPAVRICRVRAPKERKYLFPVGIYDVRDVNVWYKPILLNLKGISSQTIISFILLTQGRPDN